MAGMAYMEDDYGYDYMLQKPRLAYDLPSWVELQYFRDRHPRVWWPPEYRGMTIPEFMRYLPRREERIKLIKPQDLWVPEGFKVRFFRDKEPVVFSPAEFRGVPLRQVNKMLKDDREYKPRPARRVLKYYWR